MECQDVELSDLLPFYLNGDVTSDQATKIEIHLSACIECQQELLFWVALSHQGVPAWRRSAPKLKDHMGKRPAGRVRPLSTPPA